MTEYSKKVFGNTPQTEEQFGKKQHKNHAGGYGYKLTKWDYLNRFLIIGSETSTYYVKDRELTKENATNVLKCIEEDGVRTIKAIVEVSDSGKSVKNDACIFALALCASFGDDKTRAQSFLVLDKVARIGTHLFKFAEDVSAMRGWGRGLRKGMSNWYTNKDTSALAYQVMKYKNRNGWTHKDVLCLAHPKTEDADKNFIFNSIVNGFGDDITKLDGYSDVMKKYIIGMNMSNFVSDDVDKAVELIKEYGFPREVIPTSMMTSPKIWNALLEAKMPLTAMLRNIVNMSKYGLFEPFSNASQIVIDTITNKEHIHKSRIHPISLLQALVAYKYGNVRERASWYLNQDIIAALNEAFYLAFDNIEPTGLRYMNALDVSGSMTCGINNTSMINCIQAEAALSMALTRSEKHVVTTLFDTEMIPTTINKSMSLEEVIKTVYTGYCGTDCAQPMIYALKHKIPVDVFVEYTDNETWAGNIHPDEALRRYRDAMGIPAKLVVCAMTATNICIADPNDSGMLDIAGFSADLPKVIKEFAVGQL